MATCTYLQLPVIELPTRGVVVTEITTATESSLLQLVDELVTLAKQVVLVLSGEGGSDTTRNHNYLKKRKMAQ